MKRLVADASVAVKWFVQENLTEVAVRLAEQGPEWVVPDLFFSEVGNVFWKKVRLGEIDEGDAKEAVSSLLYFGFKVRETRPLMSYSLDLSLQFGCTVYDALYLSVAIDEGCRLVTADHKFHRIFSKTDLGASLLWIEDAI